MKLQWLRGLIVGLVVLSIPAAGADVVAKAIEVTGKADFRTGKEGAWQALKKDATLGAAQWVRTAEGARVVLQIGTRGLITVHELSTVVLSSLGDEKGQTKIGVGVYAGRTWNRFRRAGEQDESRMTVETPAAVATVRGTSFFVESDAQTQTARIGVWEGQVAVAAAAAQEKAKLVAAGFAIIVLHNQPLTDPQKLAAEDLQREQEFRKLTDDLGVAALLAPAAGIAETNKILTDEAETTIRNLNLRQKGEPIARGDLAKIKQALARLYADTKYYPGEGANKVSASKQLLCLTRNQGQDGKELPGWKGPYMDTDFADPFGGKYGVYVTKKGPRPYLILVSLGADRAPGGDDDVEVLYSVKTLEDDAQKLKTAP